MCKSFEEICCWVESETSDLIGPVMKPVSVGGMFFWSNFSFASSCLAGKDLLSGCTFSAFIVSPMPFCPDTLFVSFDCTSFVGCWPCFSCNDRVLDIFSAGVLSGGFSERGASLVAPEVAAFWVAVLLDCAGIEPDKTACWLLGRGTAD